MSSWDVEVLEGYIDDNEEHRGGSFRFESGTINLFTIRCVDRAAMIHLWTFMMEQYRQNPHWDEVTVEFSSCNTTGYAQFRHRDLRSKIISLYTHQVA